MAFGKNFKFGDATTKRSIIEKLKLQSDEVKFIQVLDAEAGVRTIVHFLKGVGAFHCWREEDEDGSIVSFGECCTTMESLEQGKFATERFSVPIMAYSFSPDGKKPAFPVTFHRLELNEDEYNNLTEEMEVLGIDNISDIKNYILRVKGVEKGKGNFKRISPSIKIINTKVTIPPEVNNQIIDFLNLFRDNIKDCIAKTIDTEKLNKMVVNLAQQPATPQVPQQQVPQYSQPVSQQQVPQYNQPVPQYNQQTPAQVPQQVPQQAVPPSPPEQAEINDVSFSDDGFDFSFVEDIDFDE